jgi:hypothetical protein
MTIGNSSRPREGDSEATKPVAATLLGDPSSPRSPLPERWAGGGSRFWALAGESSDEESDGDRSEDSATVECRSPRSGQSAVNLGDFLSPAWQRVEALKLGAAGRRRRKFAPGGHGARRLREIRSSGPRSAGGLEPAAVVSPVVEEFPPLVKLKLPVVVVPTAPTAPLPAPSVGLPASTGEDVVGAARVLRVGSPWSLTRGPQCQCLWLGLVRRGVWLMGLFVKPMRRRSPRSNQDPEAGRVRARIREGGGYLARSGSWSEP